MNLAIGAILLAILLIPPLIFFFFYGRGSYARSMPKISLLEYLLLSATICLLLHSSIIYICNIDVNFVFFFKIISGQIDEKFFRLYSNAELKRLIYGFCAYVFAVSFGCGVSGYLLKLLVTSRKLRMANWIKKFRKYRKPNEIFSYYNVWYYFFNREDYFGKSMYKNQNTLIYLYLLVETKETSIIYSGILEDFIIKENDLDSVIITNVKKRPFLGGDFSLSRSLKEGKAEKIEPEGALCLNRKNFVNIYISAFENIDLELETTNDSEENGLGLDFISSSLPDFESSENYASQKDDFEFNI